MQLPTIMHFISDLRKTRINVNEYIYIYICNALPPVSRAFFPPVFCLVVIATKELLRLSKLKSHIYTSYDLPLFIITLFFFSVLITWNAYKVIIGCLLFNYYSSVSSQKLDKYILDHNITVISPVKNQSPMTNECKMPIVKFNTSYIWDQEASELIISCKYLY